MVSWFDHAEGKHVSALPGDQFEFSVKFMRLIGCGGAFKYGAVTGSREFDLFLSGFALDPDQGAQSALAERHYQAHALAISGFHNLQNSARQGR